MWSSKNFFEKFAYLLILTIFSPFLCLLYSFSPYRDHKVRPIGPSRYWMKCRKIA